MSKKSIYNLCPAIVLMAVVLFAGLVAGQTRSDRKPGLENRLIVKPSTATPTPTPPVPRVTLEADPDLIPPDAYRKRPRPPELPRSPAYYIHIRGVTGLLLSDDQGHTDDFFQYPRIPTVRYVDGGGSGFNIILPVAATYSITLESTGGWAALEIVKGVGNSSPDEAIRYCDLDLGGKKARLEITPRGVQPLRLDTNHDGRFDTVVEATAWLRGQAAKDTHGPRLKFHVLQRNPTSLLISIEAHDQETAVKSVSYTANRRNQLPYKGPFRIRLDQAPLLFAWADDYAGNRGVAVFQEPWAPKN